MNEPSREATHESCHGVIAALLLGAKLGEIRLQPEPKCFVREPQGHREVRAHACIALAGAIADAKLEFIASEPTGDRLKAAELIDSMYAETPDELDRSEAYQDRLWMQTARLVDAYWPTILTLAEELTRTGTVSGSDVRAIVRAARPVATVAPPPRPDWVRIFADISAQATGEDSL